MAFDFKKLFKGVASSVADTPKRVVGIDFGSSSVKVVELEQRDSFVALKTYGELQLGPYADQPLGSITNLSLEKKTEALVDVMRESGVNSEHGVAALSLSSSFITVISLEAKSQDNLNARVQAEARKYIPVPLNEVTLEWTELPNLTINAPKTERQALIAAVQNTSYQEMFQLLNNVSLGAEPTEIEIFCTQRAVTKEGGGTEPVAIIDFGAQTTKLYLIKDGLVRKIHRVFSGGAQLTQSLSEKLHLGYEEAENLKRGNEHTAQESEMIKQEVISLYTRPLQEFRRVLQHFEQASGTTVKTIYCSGGASSLPEVQSLVHQVTQQEVVKAQPFSKVAYPAFMEDMLVEIAPTFTVAIGAALRAYEG